MALMPVPMEVKVLEWWPQNKDKFPHIAKMAQQFLSILATSASSERLFSQAGANFSAHRQILNMTDEHLVDLLFAKINVFMNRRFNTLFNTEKTIPKPLLTDDELTSQHAISESLQ